MALSMIRSSIGVCPFHSGRCPAARFRYSARRECRARSGEVSFEVKIPFAPLYHLYKNDNQKSGLVLCLFPVLVLSLSSTEDSWRLLPASAPVSESSRHRISTFRIYPTGHPVFNSRQSFRICCSDLMLFGSDPGKNLFGSLLLWLFFRIIMS